MTLANPQISAFDRAMIRRCLVLARRALGRTSPNPMVGAVVVRDGKVVGEGFHPAAGQPHAEVFALKDAGERAKGATLYVNLEPCNHYGRTPPCSEATIAAGIAKVVIGMRDPHREASGGIAKLQAAGITVVAGVEEAACRDLNEAFIHSITRDRPFGILKFATTLDGKIATTTGHSAWVTGEESRRRVHRLRAECDAVIVGGNTVRQDNPRLTCHDEEGRNPLRVVMSRTLNLPERAYLWQTDAAPTLVLTETGVRPDLQAELVELGVEVVEIDRLDPLKASLHLHRRGLRSLLWECGGTLAAKAIAAGTVQKIMAFIAPKIIGGQAAPSPVGELGFEKMTEALNLDRVSWQTVGSDLLMTGYLNIN